MCKGPIVAPVGRQMDDGEKNFSLMNFLKIFWERITCSGAGLDQYKVNMCPKCGDLEIDNIWLNIPNPQRSSISSEIKLGRIIISGHLVVCNPCSCLEKKIKDKSNYMDLLPHVVSSMSF